MIRLPYIWDRHSPNRPFCLILHSYLRQNGLLRQLASCTFSSNLRPFPQAFLLHTGNLKWLKSWYIQLRQWTVSFFLSILNFLVGIMSTISYAFFLGGVEGAAYSKKLQWAKKWSRHSQTLVRVTNLPLAFWLNLLPQSNVISFPGV